MGKGYTQEVRMMIAVMNNLPEMIGGLCFGGFMFWIGRKSVNWPIIGRKK